MLVRYAVCMHNLPPRNYSTEQSAHWQRATHAADQSRIVWLEACYGSWNVGQIRRAFFCICMLTMIYPLFFSSRIPVPRFKRAARTKGSQQSRPTTRRSLCHSFTPRLFKRHKWKNSKRVDTSWRIINTKYIINIFHTMKPNIDEAQSTRAKKLTRNVFIEIWNAYFQAVSWLPWGQIWYLLDRDKNFLCRMMEGLGPCTNTCSLPNLKKIPCVYA